MDDIGSIAKSLIGLTEKAVIYVPSLEAIEYWKNNPANVVEGNKIENVSLIRKMQAQSEELIRKGAEAVLKNEEVMVAGGGALAATGANQAVDEALRQLKTYNKVGVQYNPKTLTITGLGGISRSYGQGFGAGAENQITQIDNKTSITLSCELVFTNVNVSDAFMTEDLMNLNIESAASNVMNIADRAMGKSPSVQPMVDGFISVVTTNYTRWIIFAWGSTVFRGELTRVDCNYKMFNKRGDPIIATVNISIRQGFDENKTLEDHWRTQFEAVFKGKDPAQEIAGENPL